MRMNEKAIRLCIKRKELCDNPELNDRLYLNHKGFEKIRCLEKFTNLTELHLDSNEFTKIENLGSQRHLQKLYLQKNKIERIENLDCCSHLRCLDVSSNNISKIDNLGALRSLESLVIKQNKLSKPDSIRNLIYIKKLRELDLSNNSINCNIEGILEIISQCKSLKSLSLKGNPIAKSTKHYRKLVISRCLKLNQLDGTSICKEERLRVSAWGKVVSYGGSYDEADEADRQELNRIRTERCEANALHRSRHGGRGSNECCDDGSTCSKTLGTTVIDGIKRAFGLTDSSRQPSSNISWSSRRNIDLSSEDGDNRKASLKRELEQCRGIVESQRKEIVHLKEQLGQRPEVDENGDTMASIEDSERETAYSLRSVQHLAHKASQELACNMKQLEASEDVPDFLGGNDYTSPQPRSSSMVSQSQNPFTLFPPAPPPRHVSM